MNRFVQLVKKIHIHPLLWLMVGAAVLTGRFLDFLMVFFIVAVHELGHAWAAQKFHWRIKKIVFLPFGGVAEVDEHGNRPVREELLVVAAGPLQHVWLFLASFALHSGGILSDRVYDSFWQFNLAILLFNLLPIYPLDGGKLLMTFYSLRKPFLTALGETIILSAVILALMQLVVLFFLPFHLQAWCLLIYLGQSLWVGWRQRRYAFMRFLLERYYGNKSIAGKLKVVPASKEERIMPVLEKFSRNAKHIIHVSDQGKEQARLDENEVLHAYFSEKKVAASMKELMPVD